jgi:hypothetical protein
LDWFERLTGFREVGYEVTKSRPAVEGRMLTSLFNGQRYGIGELELVSLSELRARVRSREGPLSSLRVKTISADVRVLHRSPEYAGALFQVASQFNLLEMVSPEVTPERGVTRYQHDRTQGPACAIAAGAATIYRNYFIPMGDSTGQTRERQFDGLGDLGAAMASALGTSLTDLWVMRNG